MWRKIYLGLLAAVTIVCMICGIAFHALDIQPFHGKEAKETEMVESSEETEESANEHGSQSGVLSQKTEKNSSMVKKSIKTEDFTAVTINALLADIQIEEGDNYSVTYQIPQNLTMDISVEKGVLKIKQTGEGRNKVKDLKSFTEEVYITITVPDDQKLDKVKVKDAMGDIDLSDVKASTWDITDNMGDLNLQDLTGDTMTVSTDAGDIEIAKCHFTDADFVTSAGDIKVNKGTYNSLYLRTSMGDIKMTALKDWEDAQLQLETSLGEVSVGDHDYGDQYECDGVNGKSIYAETSMGDVKIYDEKD